MVCKNTFKLGVWLCSKPRLCLSTSQTFGFSRRALILGESFKTAALQELRDLVRPSFCFSTCSARVFVCTYSHIYLMRRSPKGMYAQPKYRDYMQILRAYYFHMAHQTRFGTEISSCFQIFKKKFFLPVYFLKGSRNFDARYPAWMALRVSHTILFLHLKGICRDMKNSFLSNPLWNWSLARVYKVASKSEKLMQPSYMLKWCKIKKRSWARHTKANVSFEYEIFSFITDNVSRMKTS